MPLLAPPADIVRIARPQLEYLLSRVGLAQQRGARWPRYNSWWRSVATNRAEGGAEDSQHLVGFALDLDLPVSNLAALRSTGLFVIEEDDHVHVQIYPGGSISSFVRALRR